MTDKDLNYIKTCLNKVEAARRAAKELMYSSDKGAHKLLCECLAAIKENSIKITRLQCPYEKALLAYFPHTKNWDKWEKSVKAFSFNDILDLLKSF